MYYSYGQVHTITVLIVLTVSFALGDYDELRIPKLYSVLAMLLT